ncbi:MAG: glycine--tRNA ligase [Phycisphaerales bacterium]|nr:glycine--tRNA ligase [Phycisphaerales bacterium]
MEKLVALCKRRGFIFPSSEIYGGINGFWDYGPLGVELKRNIKNAWWQDMVVNPPNGPDGNEIQMVGLDCSIIMNPKVWVASGHATGFSDPMVDCKACKARFRADQFRVVALTADAFSDTAAGSQTFVFSGYGARDEVLEANRKKVEKIAKAQGGDNVLEIRTFLDVRPSARAFVPCPECEQRGHLTDPRSFNLMFKTFVGAMEDASAEAWLRPETAQGIFANYKNVLDTSRVKIPFGIAQIGKAFRNEINPRNYTFRSREFEQMEIEYFCRDEDSMKWYEFWRTTRYQWYVGLGLKSEKLRLRDQTKEELAHYSRACADIEYLFPFSDEHQELEGCAHRGCFDLTQHMQHSGADLNYFEEELWAKFLAERKARGEPELTKDQKSEIAGKPPYRYLPTVIEPSAGADRATLAFLCEAYTEDQKPDAKGAMQTRVYMRFHPRLAPIKAAFLPLVNKDGMPELAEKLYRDAKKHFNAFYDDSGAIGRRYYRQDEAGTPYCVTIDGDTIGATNAQHPGTVTIRDRDTLEQVRVNHTRVIDWLREKIGV